MKRLLIALVLAAGGAGLVGCESKDPEKDATGKGVDTKTPRMKMPPKNIKDGG
jgi:hypothetical protein